MIILNFAVREFDTENFPLLSILEFIFEHLFHGEPKLIKEGGTNEKV